MEDKRIIEIGGVKLEVDLRHAKVVDNFKVGDNVKVLTKEYNGYKSHLGVIIGFDNFKERPTIVIAYIEDNYNPELKMLYLNKDQENVEICPLRTTEIAIDKVDMVEKLDRKISAKELEVHQLKAEKQYFLDKFGQYFEAGKAIEKVLES